MMRRLARVRRAFTLLEMLLAIAITGLLIGAASYLLVSLSTIWTLRTDDAAFDEHADGVAGFLQKAFDESYGHYQPEWKNSASTTEETASTSSDTKTTTSTTKTATDTQTTDASGNTTISNQWDNTGVSLTRIVNDDLVKKPSLHFKFFQFPPALGVTNPPTAMGIEAWLIFDERRGLAIVWKDIWTIQETTVSDDKDLLRTSLISSFVTRMDYIYWNTDRKLWLEYDEPQEESGSYTLPDFIRLSFTDRGHTITRLVHVPSAARAMPLF
jgi:prepilin-type N-terminal cleavage/methylation domain-containing protein